MLPFLQRDENLLLPVMMPLPPEDQPQSVSIRLPKQFWSAMHSIIAHFVGITVIWWLFIAAILHDSAPQTDLEV